MDKNIRSGVKNYPITLVMAGLSIISLPFFVSEFKSPMPLFILFVCWSSFITWSSEFLINKKYLNTRNFSKAKGIFGAIQTIINILFLCFCVYFFAKS